MPDPVGYNLKRAQDVLNRSMTSALSGLDLSVPQYAILQALDDAPGISSAELARRSFVTPQTMNDVVLVLERAGLLTRRQHPQHGRIRRTHLTASGRSKVAAARRRVRAIEERMLSSLTASEQRQLGAWLIACVDNLTNRELSEPASRPTR